MVLVRSRLGACFAARIPDHASAKCAHVSGTPVTGPHGVNPVPLARLSPKVSKRVKLSRWNFAGYYENTAISPRLSLALGGDKTRLKPDARPGTLAGW